jgi:hypothetical protein
VLGKVRLSLTTVSRLGRTHCRAIAVARGECDFVCISGKLNKPDVPSGRESNRLIVLAPTRVQWHLGWRDGNSDKVLKPIAGGLGIADAEAEPNRPADAAIRSVQRACRSGGPPPPPVLRSIGDLEDPGRGPVDA